MHANPSRVSFLGIRARDPERAQYALLLLPYEGGVSYGLGTASGPDAILGASAQVELWDPELGFDLATLAVHNPPPVIPASDESTAAYLDRVRRAARDLREAGLLVVGVGGDHSVTPALVGAARGATDEPLTVLHIDAHPDLRDEYGGSIHSHACAMARTLDEGADRILSIGIRSGDRAEHEAAAADERISVFRAQDLARDGSALGEAIEMIRAVKGTLYISIDIDALEVHLCPGTGTPEPGGLGWWDALRILRAAFLESRGARVIGWDLVETAPMPGTRVNEFVAAGLLAKSFAYHAAGRLGAGC